MDMGCCYSEFHALCDRQTTVCVCMYVCMYVHVCTCVCVRLCVCYIKLSTQQNALLTCKLKTTMCGARFLHRFLSLMFDGNKWKQLINGNSKKTPKKQNNFHTITSLKNDMKYSISHRSFMVDPLSYFSFQPVLHDWFNKGRGMCYPVCGMVHIK